MIKGIFGKIFGSTKVVDAGMKAIDAMVFTAEEKSQKKAELLKLYEPFKLAQRYLAMLTAINFFVLVWVSVGVYFFANEKLDGLLSLLGEFQIGYLMLVVIGWYFTGGIVDFKRKK